MTTEPTEEQESGDLPQERQEAMTYTKPTRKQPFIYTDGDGDQLGIHPAIFESDGAFLLIRHKNAAMYVSKGAAPAVAAAILHAAGWDRADQQVVGHGLNNLLFHVESEERIARIKAQQERDRVRQAQRDAAKEILAKRRDRLAQELVDLPEDEEGSAGYADLTPAAQRAIDKIILLEDEVEQSRQASPPPF